MFSQWSHIAAARLSMFTLMGLTRPLLLELKDKPPIELRGISEIRSLGNLYDERNFNSIELIELRDIPEFHRLILLLCPLHPAQHQEEAVEHEYL
jgi:hypothetical protein